MSLNISVDMSDAINGLGAISARVEAEVLNALDEVAGLVANQAKTDHPKVADGFQGKAADAFRMTNWATSGEYAGSYRFLTRTQNLVNSILPDGPARKVGTALEAHVVSGMEYSDQIEFGSVNSRPFPFMRPALEINRGEAVRRITLAVQRGTA